MAGNASSNGVPRFRGANLTSRISRIHHEKGWIDEGEATGSCEAKCRQALKAFLHAQSPQVLADWLLQLADRGSAINTELQ
jgi:hypothetical protein